MAHAPLDRPIVALATPWGRSALAVVRLSGAGCHDVVRSVARPRGSTALTPGVPRRVDLVDGDEVFDDGIAWLQAAPHTYTGEDTAELTLHGNPVLIQRLLDALVAAGAALAGPGAFTRRALEHGKLDPIRAEGVAQAIAATTRSGARAARQALSGALGRQLAGLREPIVQAIAELEARLDVPGDETAELDDDQLLSGLREVSSRARSWADGARGGHHLVHGARVALVGAVNAGKSSLLNALVGRRRALVSPIPGTTRDVVEAVSEIEGVAITWLDTAGERPTDDPIEAAGLALARELVEEADLLVVVLRARPEGLSDAEQALLQRTADRPRLVVRNGVDTPHDASLPVDVQTVALTGEGVPALQSAVRAALVGELPADAVPVVASLWQAGLLREVADAVDEAVAAVPIAGVAVGAELLHQAIAGLDALTGADTREDVLDALFARFCVGK